MGQPHKRCGVWGMEMKITFIYVHNGKTLSGSRIKINFWRLGPRAEVWVGLSLDLQQGLGKEAANVLFCLDVPSCFNEAHCIVTTFPLLLSWAVFEVYVPPPYSGIEIPNNCFQTYLNSNVALPSFLGMGFFRVIGTYLVLDTPVSCMHCSAAQYRAVCAPVLAPAWNCAICYQHLWWAIVSQYLM